MIAADSYDSRTATGAGPFAPPRPLTDWPPHVMRWVPFVPVVAALLIAFMFAVATAA